MADSIRVILAEDSPTTRRYLAALIHETPDMEVVGEARTGAEAVMLVAKLKPDVVSMDIKMPDVDGLEATRQIMATHPTPVVVVSGMLDSDVQLSLEALEAGALAVVRKPPERNNPAFNDKRRELITTLRAMSSVKVISRRSFPAPLDTNEVDAPEPRRAPEIIAIAASTGGPSALSRLLHEFPDDCPVPIVLAQHMPQEFMQGLVKWLQESTSLNVQLVEDGIALKAGYIYVAQGAQHLCVARQDETLIAKLVPDEEQSRYVPSADVLFHSIAETCGAAAIGVVLTGMGDDGAKGLHAMFAIGAHTIVQNEASSTVYGMPRAAIECGAAKYIESLTTIAATVQNLL